MEKAHHSVGLFFRDGCVFLYAAVLNHLPGALLTYAGRKLRQAVR